ncbi:MAG: hypothetical protein ACP5HU_08035 [Phycisphaerae bacterium]
MLALRRSLCLTFALVVFVLSGGTAPAQDADADQAREMLQDGIAHYEALEFSEARDVLMEVDADALADQQRQLLDDYLRRTNTAIREQAAAEEAFESAQYALANGDLAEAEAGFATAAGSEYLPADVREEASEQLALVRERRSRQQAADADSSELAEIAEAAPEMQPLPLNDGSAEDESSQQRRETDESETRQGPRPVAELEVPEPRAEEVDSARVVSRLQQRRTLARQQAELDYEEAMRLSNEAMPADSAAGFDNAEEHARVARNIIESNKSLFTAEQYRELIERADDQLAYVRNEREEWEKQRARQQQRELAELQAEREAREAEQRQRKVETLKEQVRSLERKQEYHMALDTVEQILQLDPENTWAVYRQDWLQTLTLVEDQDAIETRSEEQEQEVILDVLRSQIPWHELLRYPRDWKELTARRAGAGAAASAESERDRAVRRQMTDTVLQRVEFDGIAFGDVVEFLREVSDLNIYVNWNALQTLGIDQTVPVNVHLSNVSFEKVLRTVLDDVGGVMAELSYVIDEGVITISSQEDLSRRTVTRVYDILDLIHPIPDHSAPSLELGRTKDGGTTGGGGTTRGGWLFKDTGGDGEDGEPARGAMIENIVSLIEETIDPNSWRPIGDIGSVRELGGQLVITQTAQNHQDIVGLLNQLREAAQLQVSIETRFLVVSSSFLNRIGVNLDFYFNIGSRLGSSSTIDPWTGAIVPTNEFYDAGAGVWVPTASGWGAGKPGGTPFTPISATGITGSWVGGLQTGVPGSVGSGVTPFTIAGTFLDDIQVDFLLEAVQAHEGSRTMNAPRVTMLNGQRANVILTNQSRFVTDVEVDRETIDVGDEDRLITTYEYDFETLEYGTVLDVRATVSGDRRYVTLNLSPNVTSLEGFDTFIIGFDPETGNPISIQEPRISQQTVNTTVTVPDGGTLMIGGRKLSGNVDREHGVPLLSKVPIINRAFTNRAEVRDEYSLLILVKPKIIIRSEAEQNEDLYQEAPMLP